MFAVLLHRQDAPMAVIPPIGVGSQQRTVLGHAARAAVGGLLKY
jgi:hypothetical protein